MVRPSWLSLLLENSSRIFLFRSWFRTKISPLHLVTKPLPKLCKNHDLPFSQLEKMWHLMELKITTLTLFISPKHTLEQVNILWIWKRITCYGLKRSVGNTLKSLSNDWNEKQWVSYHMSAFGREYIGQRVMFNVTLTASHLVDRK